jgi:ferritin-like metal-binding protein YciE
METGRDDYSPLHKMFMAGKLKKASKTNGLRKLFINELKDSYWVEKAMLRIVPNLIKNSKSADLENSLIDHLEKTKKHIKKLEEVFKNNGRSPVAKKCKAMEGIIKESKKLIEETESGPLGDSAIIVSCQKMKHYEIASYGTLSAFARAIGEDESVSLLDDILSEEKHVDKILSELAESFINAEAI